MNHDNHGGYKLSGRHGAGGVAESLHPGLQHKAEGAN